MRSASEFHRRSVENLRRRWGFVFQSPARRDSELSPRAAAPAGAAPRKSRRYRAKFKLELEKPSHALALLRARRERPHSGRTAEQRDELAAPHSITSSAVASSACGTLRPRTFAVCRLMTNSNLAARITGSSPAFSPLRMRPV